MDMTRQVHQPYAVLPLVQRYSAPLTDEALKGFKEPHVYARVHCDNIDVDAHADQRTTVAAVLRCIGQC